MSGQSIMSYFDLPAAEVLERAARVRLLALDVDGVLTDGHIYMGNDGELMKAFHIHDGKGISMLQSAGVPVAILTARSSGIVQRRAEELGIAHVLQGRKEKWPALQALLEQLNLSPEQVAFAGDDLVDLPVLRRVGLAVAVGNAHPWVSRHCHWRSRRDGGAGAVRELCELILHARGDLQGQLDSYVD